MKVGDSVRLAIDLWELGEVDGAMLLACVAVDGTAGKVYPAERSNAYRFTQLLRENYDILGPMGAPGINLSDTRFPVMLRSPQAPGGRPDIADVVYGIHRCHHGHGEALPEGFELIQDASRGSGVTRMGITQGSVQLSDRIIFGLLAVAVLSPSNANETMPDGYHLRYGKLDPLLIAEWWGRASDFADLIALEPPPPQVTLDFGDWMDGV